MEKQDLEKLREAHAPDKIRERMLSPAEPSYLADAVLGAIDGCVTTLAIVAGATGAQFAPAVAIVLGSANLLADGFSMAVSNYQSAHTRQDLLERARREEHDHVRHVPEGEVEEIRQIFAAKGFTGADLDKIVEVITADTQRWVDTMVVEEHGLSLVVHKPWKSALSTFAAFLSVGIIPLLPLFILANDAGRILPASLFLSLLAFFGIGVLKGHVLGSRRWRYGITTMLSGGAAAALAFAVGAWLRGVVTLG